jgi:hypothetical protein
LFEHQDYQKYDEIVPPVNSQSMDEDYSPLKINTISRFPVEKELFPTFCEYFQQTKESLIEKLIGYANYFV